MKELASKEKLTKNRCRFDVKHDISKSLVSGIVLLTIVPILIVLLIYSDYNMLGVCLYMALFAGFVFLFVWSIVLDIIHRKRIKNYKFFIVEDVVIGKQIYYTRRGRERHILELDRCTDYILPFENYIWSDYSKATDIDVYNATNIGDKFYVVVPLSQRNNTAWQSFAVYNTKYFELSDKSFVRDSQDWFVKGE